MEIKTIKEKIKKGECDVLGERVAVGTVYKISEFGNLDADGFEVGYLYLTKGSAIKDHEHTNDIEEYRLLEGILKIGKEEMEVNICKIGGHHSIDIVEEDTIIRTIKISKKYLEINNCIDYIEEKIFNKVYQKINNSK